MDDREVLEFHYGGGCVSLFGLPFFLGGLGTLSIPIVEMSGGKGFNPALLVPALMSLPFLAVGAGLLLGRAGLSLDRRRRKIIQWWGLLIPFRTTERDLQDLEQVGISVDRRGGKNKHTVYPVLLEGKTGEPIEIEAPGNHFQARQVAEKLAKFLGLGIADTSMGVRTFRPANSLDEPLRDRILRQDGPAPLPSGGQPPRLQYQSREDTGAFILPKVGFTGSAVISLIVGVLFVAIFVVVMLVPLVFMLEKANSWIPVAIMLGSISLPMVGVLGAIIAGVVRTVTQQEKLLASPRGITIERSDWFGTTKTAMPSQELEELEKGISSGGTPANLLRTPILFARSDKVELEFGQGLTPDEIDWLAKTIRHHLTREPEV